ncbi:MAG: RNA methyltransferase [Cyanobacteria bacterium P01_G01_bin.19]
MENIILTSIQNPLVKQARKLQRAKERQKQNLLLLEGTNLIEAACQVDYKLDIIFYTDRWRANHQSLCSNMTDMGFKLQPVSEEVLSAIATTVNPDGVVAIAPRRLQQEPIVARTKLGIAVEKLQDPGNLGTLIRSASATGADSLWLSNDSVDIHNPKVLRASVGQWFSVPVATQQSLAKVVSQHQQEGIQVIATTSQAEKIYWDANFTRPSLILLGNEGAGLSDELIALADERVKIPLQNGVESLNVAVAGALLLYEAQRQILSH